MAITAGELQFILKAQDQMTRTLKSVDSNMAKAEKSGLNLKKALVAVGGALAVKKVVDLGVAFGKMVAKAAPIENVRKAFAGISGDASTMLASLQKGSMGMITQTELMKSYNSAAQLVGKTFADQLPNAMGYLGKVSAATGEDMGYMLDSLVKGVGRLSPMILDNLGIQVNLTEANQAYADQLGISVEEMTKSQQQAALMNQVLAKLKDNTAAMPEVMGTLNQRLEAAKTRFADVKQQVGEAFIPVLATLAETALPMVSGALDNILPIAESAAEWLGENLPIAIANVQAGFELVSGYIIDTVIPVFESVQAFVRDNLEPILAGLATVLAGALYAGMSSLAAVITGTVVPAVTAWATTTGAAAASTIAALAPVLLPIAAIGAAVALLVKAWKEDWGGIQTKTREVWDNHLQPIFETAKEWLETKLTVAIETLTGFWNDTLMPALEAVWAFVSENIIPIFEALANVAIALVKVEILALAALWTEVLRPALKAVWQFLSENVLPVLKRLSDVIIAGLKLQVEALAGLWKNTLHPALKVVWEFIQDKLLGKLGSLKDTLNGVKGALQGAADWLNKLADKIRNLPGLPSWMQRHSPSEIEQTFAGMAELLPQVVNGLSHMDEAMPDASKWATVGRSFQSLISSFAGMMSGGSRGIEALDAFSDRASGSRFGAMGLEGLRDWIVDHVIPVVRGIHAAMKQLPLLAAEEIGDSLALWAERYRGIATILDAANKAADLLHNKSEAFKIGAPKGLETIRDAVIANVIPVIRGVHAAFKNLPLLDEEEVISDSLQIWGERYKGIAAILDAANKVADLLANKSEAFKRGAPKGLIAIRDAVTKYVIPVIRGVHAAFKNLPLLDDEEVISESLALWAKRYQGISAILGSVNTAVEMLSNKSDKFKSGAAKGLIAIRDAVTQYVIPVIRGIHAAFKNLPLLDTDEVIAESLQIWGQRFGAIASILDGVNQAVNLLTNKSDKFKSAAAKGLEAIRDAVTTNVVPVIRGIHAALKTLPVLDEEEVISASLKIWSDRLSAGVGIITDTMTIANASLETYVSPDLAKIERIAKDGVAVVEKVMDAVDDMYTTAEEMAPKIAMLQTIKGMVGDVRTTISDTIEVAQGLAEMSWREIKQHQVDSFTANLANIVKWLTDPTKGMAAIKNLADMSGYATAAGYLGEIVTDVVEAVKDVMTLPAVWDNRISVIAAGFAGFFADIKAAILTHGTDFIGAWAALADDALRAIVHISGNVGRDVIANFAGVLNDGVFYQLGQRNARAYGDGWRDGLEIRSPSKVAQRIRDNFMAGLNGDGQSGNQFHLHVTTTAPAVDVVGSYRLLESMA